MIVGPTQLGHIAMSVSRKALSWRAPSPMRAGTMRTISDFASPFAASKRRVHWAQPLSIRSDQSTWMTPAAMIAAAM